MKLLSTIRGTEALEVKKTKRTIRVADVMSTGIVTLTPNDSFDAAIDLMVTRDYQYLIVTDDEKKVVGLISKGDIVGTRWNISDWRNKEVHQAMRKNPMTVTFRTLLSDAISKMLTEKLSCLPVVNDSGALCGMLTSVDIMKSHLKVLAAME